MALQGTNTLKIKIGATEFNATVTKAEVVSGAASTDFNPFSSGPGGAREYRLEFTAGQDYAAASLWDQVFSNSGTTVACILNPSGVGTYTATNPGFTFNAVISEPDGTFIGGEYNQDNSARFTFECSWVLTAKPTRVTTGTY